MIRGPVHLSCDNRLRELGLFSLDNTRLRGDLIVASQYLKDAYRKFGENFFCKACCNSRSNGFKLREDRFGPDIKKKFITVRVMKHCKRLPREVMETPSLETFKARLDGSLSNLM